MTAKVHAVVVSSEVTVTNVPENGRTVVTIPNYIVSILGLQQQQTKAQGGQQLHLLQKQMRISKVESILL